MSGIFYRIIIAVIGFVLFMALMPPVLRVIGVDLGGDVLTIIKICAGAIALLYILRGPVPPWVRT